MLVSRTFGEDHKNKTLYILSNYNIQNLRKGTQKLSHLAAGQYEWERYFKGVTCIGTYNEVLEYCRNSIKITKAKPTWNKNTKVAFGDSSFPSLLLGRLDADLKRTTNFDKADYVIVDDFNLYSQSNYIYILGSDSNENYILYGFGYNEDKTKIPLELSTAFPEYTFQFFSTCSKQRQEFMDIVTKYPNKLVKTETFIKYVYSSVPPSDEEEMKSMISMLESKDYNLGFQTLVYYNFFDYIPKILQSLINKKVISTSASSKFVYYILNTTGNKIYDLSKSSPIKRLNYLGNIKNNPYMTNKALLQLQQLLNEQLGIEINNTFKDALDALNAHIVVQTNDA